MLGLIVGSALPLEWLTSGPSLCPFKVMTGLPCPGCGLTRSAVAFLHGDPATSLFFHPLGAPIVIAAVAIGLVDAWVWWRGAQAGDATVLALVAAGAAGAVAGALGGDRRAGAGLADPAAALPDRRLDLLILG